MKKRKEKGLPPLRKIICVCKSKEKYERFFFFLSVRHTQELL